ncbi:hypothetical protein [Xanthomonas sacchari]|uniref:hypothetical protein n=1 Tax=Xanthomonas sacchari TaxID=56458 RepID=UPI0020C479F2|nr:hypothetical protein [Xanthomonas sacchari]
MSINHVSFQLSLSLHQLLKLGGSERWCELVLAALQLFGNAVPGLKQYGVSTATSI